MPQLLPHRRIRLQPVVAACVLLAGCCAQTAAAQPAEKNTGKQVRRPNILFIYSDDQSYRTVSCYPEAYPWAKTPNIDRLAERGTRFSYAYIGTWCMPSRATLLTGHHPYGVESMRMEGAYPGSAYDPEQCPFWPGVFRQHGYVTAQIGKWHTGTDTGYGRDWDHQIVWNRPKFPENSGNYYYDQMISMDGGEDKLIGGYSTDNYTRWAQEFIRGEHRDPEKPWYLWLCYGAVHGPYTPAKRHLDEYPGVKVPDPADIYPPRPGKPGYMQTLETWIKGPDGEPVLKPGAEAKASTKTLSQWLRQYNQAVLALDEGIGAVLKTLEESGQLENTLVVYTADQGFAWGEHGFRHKLGPYDATIRAPMVISMPGTLPEGKVCETPVGGADLVPTFFRFAGIELPWKMHGHDLTPLLKNASAEWPYSTLITMTGNIYGSATSNPKRDAKPHGAVPWYVMLRQKQFKYIRTLVADEPEEIYDLQNDPEELTNLAQDTKHSELLLLLRAEAIAELKRTDAAMVENLPAVGMGNE